MPAVHNLLPAWKTLEVNSYRALHITSLCCITTFLRFFSLLLSIQFFHSLFYPTQSYQHLHFRDIQLFFLGFLHELSISSSSSDLFWFVLNGMVYEGFYNFSKVCLQFFSFLNVVFPNLFYDNITFRHLFIIIKCPAELNFDCKILIRSMPYTFVTGWLSRGDIFYTWPKPTPSCMCSEANNNALSKLSYILTQYYYIKFVWL